MSLIGRAHVQQAWETFSQLFCQIAVPRHTLGTLVTFTVTHLPFETRGLLLYVYAFAKFVSGLYRFHMLKINTTCISLLKSCLLCLLASLLTLTSSQTPSRIYSATLIQGVKVWLASMVRLAPVFCIEGQSKLVMCSEN